MIRLVNLITVLVSVAILSTAVQGQIDDIEIRPVGSYKDIDVKADNKLVKRLTGRSERKRARALEAFLEDPSSYSPPVIYAASFALFESGQKDEAAFWFYAGQLRARFDANRCADQSAGQAVGVLNQNFGTPINQYAFQDLNKLQETVERSVKWDSETPHNYDHRWINLHGMDAMIASMEGSEKKQTTLSKPASEWGAIAKQTRADYLQGFQEALARMETGQ